jgi:hypothetical protein
VVLVIKPRARKMIQNILPLALGCVRVLRLTFLLTAVETGEASPANNDLMIPATTIISEAKAAHFVAA